MWMWNTRTQILTRFSFLIVNVFLVELINTICFLHEDQNILEMNICYPRI